MVQGNKTNIMFEIYMMFRLTILFLIIFNVAYSYMLLLLYENINKTFL
jgi:hypothetical protein